MYWHQSHQLSPFKSIASRQVAFTHDFAEILRRLFLLWRHNFVTWPDPTNFFSPKVRQMMPHKLWKFSARSSKRCGVQLRKTHGGVASTPLHGRGLIHLQSSRSCGSWCSTKCLSSWNITYRFCHPGCQPRPLSPYCSVCRCDWHTAPSQSISGRRPGGGGGGPFAPPRRRRRAVYADVIRPIVQFAYVEQQQQTGSRRDVPGFARDASKHRPRRRQGTSRYGDLSGRHPMGKSLTIHRDSAAIGVAWGVSAFFSAICLPMWSVLHFSCVRIIGNSSSLKGHVNLEIFGLVHLNHAAGFLHSNSGVKMS